MGDFGRANPIRCLHEKFRQIWHPNLAHAAALTVQAPEVTGTTTVEALKHVQQLSKDAHLLPEKQRWVHGGLLEDVHRSR